MAGTILVKKKDGIQVRMTMDEFKEYRENTKTSKHQNIKTSEAGSEAEGEKMVEEIVDVDIKDKEINRDKEIEKTIVEPVTEPQTPIVESAISNHQSADDESQAQVIQTHSKSRELKADSQDLPMVEEPHELAMTTPVKDIFVDEAVYTKTQKHKNTKTQPHLDSSVGVSSIESPKQNSVKNWTKEDNKSPLEDEVEELRQHEALEILPDKKQDLFTEVLKKIKFPVPDDLQARFHSLISSRVKEVRSDDQFLSYVGYPVDAGGLGLDDNQSQELLQTVKDVWRIVAQKKPEKIQVIKDPIELQKPEEVKKQVTKLNISLPRKKLEGKPVLHDMVQPKPVETDGVSNLSGVEKQSIGPIEEIKKFSLIDLRRMGNDSADNFKKLLQKFKDLKKDSIVLYLEAVQTWYESPLYKQYQDLIFRALDTGVKVKDLAIGGETLTWEEVQGVINLQTKLI